MIELLCAGLIGSTLALIPLTSDNWHVGKYLMVIDNYILEILNITRVLRGRRLLEHTSDYLETFKEFREEVKMKVPSTNDAVKFMLEYNGPQFIHKHLGDVEKKKLFGDNENSLKIYKNLSEQTKDLWNKFVLDIAEVKHNNTLSFPIKSEKVGCKVDP